MDLRCPWSSRQATPPGPEALPEEVEVVVVGAGLAGVATALFLAQAGYAPLVVEARPDVGLAGSGRVLGQLVAGLVEHPWRLVDAVGLQTAREIYRFCDENTSLLAELVEVDRCGGLWAASLPGEERDIERDLRALEDIGVPAAHWTAEQVGERTGAAALGPGVFIPGDGLVDPAGAVRQIAARASEAGARIVVDAPVHAVDDDPDGLVVVVGARRVRAEVVVFAANPWLPGIDSFFEETITPVREQALAVSGGAGVVGFGCRAGHAYLSWRPGPDGALLVGGARWATPHLEVGETDDGVVVAAVQDKLLGFVARQYPALGERPVTHRWSWIRGNSCDGLPLIGPVPGAPRRVCCAGFNGNQLGLAVRAARGVADGLLTGRALGVPACMVPSRMV